MKMTFRQKITYANTQNTDHVLHSIRNIFSFMPIAFIVIALIGGVTFLITPKKYAEIKEQLDKDCTI